MDKTILIIEDNPEVSDNISGILELERYKVLTAPNGKVGVALAQQYLPDLILCDIMMPELDGYGVLHAITNDADTAGIPFIFLTAKADKTDFRTGMNLGADDYITKPFEGSDLLKVVETRLHKTDRLKNIYRNDLDEVNSFLNHATEVKVLQKLAGSRHKRHFRKKEFVFMDGQSPNDLYMVNKGEVKTYKVNSDGKELITGFFQEGSFLGYVPLLEGTSYGESAVAMVDTEVVIIPKQDFLNLLYSSKDLAHKFITILTSNLTEAQNRLLEIAYQSVRQRVASSLLRLNQLGASANKMDIIDVSRKDISSMIGTATESLNRTLSDFKDEKLIDLTDKGIRILDKPKLERLAR